MNDLERFLRFLADVITYILLFLVNPGHTWKEVRSERLNINLPKEKVLPKYYGQYLVESKEFSIKQRNRLSSNNEKCNSLLTISAFLFATQAAIISYQKGHLFSLIPIFFTSCSIFLVLRRDRVSPIAYVSAREYFNRHLTKKQLQKKLIKDFHNALHHNDCVIDLKIGLYTAARRMLILSIAMTMLLQLLLIVQSNTF